MNVTKTISWDDLEKEQSGGAARFSRKGSKKQTDEEQLRIFVERQKRLPELWRAMGITGYSILERRNGEWVELRHCSLL